MSFNFPHESEGKLLQKLPDSILERTIGFTERDPFDQPEVSFLKLRLPSNDIIEIEGALKKRYNLTTVRAIFRRRVKRKGCAKHLGLSSSKKRQLGLYNISRKGLKYKDLIPLHQCWQEYMTNVLDLPYLQESGWKGELDTPVYEEFVQQIWKADYHGAYIKVYRSTCPSLVGIEGILVFETRNTVKLLGKDDNTRSIPKSSCEFVMKLGVYEIKMLGKHIMIKPSERTVKKIKQGKVIDL